MTDAIHAHGRHASGCQGKATVPPRSEVSGGPDTPLEIGRPGWRNTQARAEQLDGDG